MTEELSAAELGIVDGQIYRLRHARFGEATVKILSQHAMWIDIEVTQGELRGIRRGSQILPGGQRRVRACHCYFSTPPTE